MRWAICWCVGTKTEVVVMNLDRMREEPKALFLFLLAKRFERLKILDMNSANGLSSNKY